jgi:Putative beta barrel porin-7 (BBP7)
MNVHLLGPLLLLALIPSSAFAQDAPPSSAKPPAQPPLAQSLVPPPFPPPVVEENGPATSIVIEPADTKPSTKSEEEPASVRSLWRYGDGGEYLLWYIKNSRVPALVVGTPGGAVTGTNGGTASVPNLPGGRVLFGDTNVDMEDRSGGLFTLSVPLNNEKTIGFHATYFFLGSRGVNFLGGGNGGPDSPVVARPYIDALTGAETLRTVAAPGVADGAIHVSMTSRLQGVEANGVGNVLGGEHFQIDLLAGFRFLQLAEGLEVLENERYLAGAGELAGTTFGAEDRISANTRFYGGQIGSRLEFRRDGAFMNFTGKIAFGDSVEVVRFTGTSITTGPSGTTITPNGVLLSPRSNAGRYSHESFALLPEFDLRVGYDLSEQARFFVGYSLIYLSEAVRPGDQIDGTVNTAPASGGPARPSALLRTTDFWAQGLTLGFEYSY